MNTAQPVNIYECFDPNGDAVKFICNGHIDAMMFRDKCYQDYFVKPMVVQHQWQKMRKYAGRREGKKFYKGVTKTVSCKPGEMGATPITVGMIQA